MGQVAMLTAVSPPLEQVVNEDDGTVANNFTEAMQFSWPPPVDARTDPDLGSYVARKPRPYSARIHATVDEAPTPSPTTTLEVQTIDHQPAAPVVSPLDFAQVNAVESAASRVMSLEEEDEAEHRAKTLSVGICP